MVQIVLAPPADLQKTQEWEGVSVSKEEDIARMQETE